MQRHLASALCRAVASRVANIEASALTAGPSTSSPAAALKAAAAVCSRSTSATNASRSSPYLWCQRRFATQTAGKPTLPGEGVQLSDSAVERLQELSLNSREPVVLRLTVEGGGCSGFQYEFTLDSSAKEGDRVFERDGATVVMDDVSYEFLRGATVDFEADLMRAAFVVQSNPNAASSCGCGSSFVAK